MNFNKVLLICFFILFSCEPDDLCLETYPDTPKLIIKFFDINSQESVLINNLTVEDTERNLVLFTGSTDSISIPLNYTKQQTVLNFIYKTNHDKVYVNYNTNEAFVSKGCGFRMEYLLENIIVENDNENWICSLEILNKNVVEELNHHVKIFFSFFSFFINIELSSQENNIENDSISIKKTYGIRLGLDLSKQIRMLTEDYKGLSLYSDLKIKEDIFVVLEVGNDNKTINDENINSKVNGSYYKLGFNYNFYKNLPGLNNEIYFGIRYGMSKFNNELLSFKVYDIDNNWNNESIVVNRKFSNLNAGWVELIIGFNAEISKNIYMGISLRVNRLINQEIPSNFTNFFIPGFNKVTENNNFGTGITYNLIYQLPILRK